MAEIWKGAPVAAALTNRASAAAADLKRKGVIPTLGILRVGEREEDLSYERGAVKRCAQAGVEVRRTALPAEVSSGDFFSALDAINRDPSIHGILMFRPLPPQLDGERARQSLNPAKDVDGCTDGSLAGVFINAPLGFPPCTAQAVLELLRYYDCGLAGKRAAVIGRSLVVGRPAALLLLHANATVTLCHTGTRDVAAVAREADILVTASGCLESIGKSYVHPDQIVVDVGIGWSEARGKLCGDLRFEEVEPVVRAVTPVPGGVGAVTSSVLVCHVVEAARRQTAGEG